LQFDDLHFHVVAVGQPAPQVPDFGGLVQAHSVVANENVPTGTYLLRPDGHVGLCGTRLDAETVTRYLREQVRLV
jgi:hypothetical protein